MSALRFIGTESEAQKTPMSFITGFYNSKSVYWNHTGASQGLFTRFGVNIDSVGMTHCRLL